MTLESGQDPYPDLVSAFEIKSRIRICIETSADPQHCYSDAKPALPAYIHGYTLPYLEKVPELLGVMKPQRTLIEIISEQKCLQS